MGSDSDRTERNRRTSFPSRRRRFLAGVASTGAAGIAGCFSSDDDTGDDAEVSASFTADPEEGVVPLEVEFDASDSSAEGTDVEGYEWDFDDGTADSGANVTHTYEEGGEYTVELTVTGADGTEDSATAEISVSGEPMTLAVVDSSEYSVSLSWVPSEEDVDRYNVYVDPGEKMHPWQEDSTYLWTRTADTAVDVHGLNGGTEYDFFVAAEVDREEFESTNAVTGTTAGDPPEYHGPPRHPETGNPTYGQWTHSLIGAGGKTTGVKTTPANPNVVYLRTDASGTYRSDDKGENWYMIREGWAARGFLVDPRDEDTVVLAENDGLYYSEQVGANYGDDELTVDDVWDHVLDVGFPHSNGTFREFGGVLARKPDDPDTLIATPEAGPFYRSTDNGRSWEALSDTPGNLHPTDVRYDPHNPEHVYVCAQAEDRYAGPGFDPGLYRSTDNGDSWEQVLADPSEPPVELAFDPETGDIYGLFGQEGDNAGENEVRRSTDGGETWESWGDGLVIDGEVASIQVNPHDDRVYVTAGDELSRADVAAGSGFIFRLPAGGDEWERHAPVGPEDVDASHWWDALDSESGSSGFDGVAGIGFDRADPEKWYLSATYAVYTSPDAGRRWRYASKGIEEMVGMDVTADPDPDSDLVHAGIADMQYYRLEDHGIRMELQRTPDIHNAVCVAVSPADPDRIYSCSANYIYNPPIGRFSYSEDRGESWTPIDADDAGLPAVDTERWYEGSYGPDSELNRVSPVINGIAVDPTDADHVAIALCGTYGSYVDRWWGGFSDDVLDERDADEAVGIWRSTDGGRTFEEVPGELEGHVWNNFWAQGNHLAMSGDGSMVVSPMITGPVQYWDPEAEDWFAADIPADGNPYDVAADPNTDGRFMVPLMDGDGGVYETRDGGETWQQLVPDRAHAVAYHPNDSDRMAIGRTDGPALYSDDGGETWYELDPAKSGGGNHLTFSGENLVAGAGGSSYFVADLASADLDVYEPEGGE